MRSFTYERARTPAEAAAAVATTQVAKFIAGGTNLLDLMKLEIEVLGCQPLTPQEYTPYPYGTLT